MKHTDDSSKKKFANQRANHKEKRERKKVKLFYEKIVLIK